MAAIAPSPTGTAFCIAWPRMRSSRAASSIVKRARGAERGIFAERVAGDERRVAGDVEPGHAFERAQRRQARRHQRRLGVGGQRQLRLRAFEDQAAELLAERRVDALEHFARSGKGFGERLAHADRLRALAGKYQGGFHPCSLSRDCIE